MFVGDQAIDPLQPHQINGQQPILGARRPRILHRRPIHENEAQMPREQRSGRRPQQPAQQRLDSRHTRFQAPVDRRIGEALLEQGELPRRFPQHRV